MGSSSARLREIAYYQLSDTLLLFNRTYAVYGTPLRGLACPPSAELVEKMKKYFNDQLTNMEDTGTTQSRQGAEDEEDDDGQDRESLVVFEKKRLVSALGKLIAANAFPDNIQDHAADILVHFVVCKEGCNCF